jgi:hypothetical protein
VTSKQLELPAGIDLLLALANKDCIEIPFIPAKAGIQEELGPRFSRG